MPLHTWRKTGNSGSRPDDTTPEKLKEKLLVKDLIRKQK